MHVYSKLNSAWGTIALSGWDSTAKAVMYNIDGVLRISDGNFGSGAENIWYGYVKRTRFYNWSGTPDNRYSENSWILTNQYLIGPDFTSVNRNTSLMYTPVTDIGSIVIDLVETVNAGNSSTWNNRKFQFAMSAVYDGNQESPLITPGTYLINDNVSSNDYLTPALDNKSFSIRFSILATVRGDINPRITGYKLYAREYDVVDLVEDWWLQGEINLIDGGKGIEYSQFSIWKSYTDGTNTHTVTDFLCDNFSKVSTYNDETGYGNQNITPSELTPKYKAAAVAGRSVYIGGLEMNSNDPTTKSTIGDVMIRSNIDQFDVFPTSRTISVSVRDGDEIVALETYADRLLQFKREKLHIINISQEVEFLEDTVYYKGVSHPESVTRTDFGVAWANNLGVYLYDGKNIINLFEKSGRQVISEKEWGDFLTANKDGVSATLTPMVGYLPKRRQLIIFDDISNGSTTDPRLYIYDITSQSWTKGSQQTTNREVVQLKTNFTTDWNGDLMYAYSGTGTFVKWDDTGVATDKMNIITKDIDFGQPAQRKKIYKIYVTYKTSNASNSSGVLVQYDTDGETSFAGGFSYIGSNNTFVDGTNEYTSAGGLLGTDDWHTIALTPTSSINNIYSFQLKFHTPNFGHADFEINDISIVYRLKPVK